MELPLNDPGPPIITSQRSGRSIRMPARFQDFLPGSSTHLAHMPPSAHQQRLRDKLIAPPPGAGPSWTSPPHSEGSENESQTPEQPSLVPFTTEPDDFGLYRVYHNTPTHVNLDTLQLVCDLPNLESGDTVSALYRYER
jgi:hypothetical protein